MRSVIAILLTMVVPVTSFAGVADTAVACSVIERIATAQSDLRRMTPEAFSNPALRQWMLPVSLSRIAVGYDARNLTEAIDDREGADLSGWSAGAESYMKHRSSTLWGSVIYANRRLKDVIWNESSDYELIYPYTVADSIGGDMNSESYALAGGYADHNDRWAWGAEISYVAGLHYRAVDPRPRNVTGNLHLKGAAAWRIPSSVYRLSASLGYRRYRQSADITFVNDLADNRIWHLTGLGTHYERFASQGYSHSYAGNGISATVNIYPQSGRGVSASVEYGRFAFDHILKSLNNMPLQRATDSHWIFEAAWLHPSAIHDLALTISVALTKRLGTENIFGDASAGIYPQIGSLQMYSHTMADASIRFLWEYRPVGSTTVSVEPRLDFNRSRQTYVDPARLMLIGKLAPGVDASVNHVFAKQWLASLDMRADCSLPAGCSLDMTVDPQSPAGMQQLEIDRYRILSRAHWRSSATLSLSRSITRRYALMIALTYCRSCYADAIRGNSYSASLSFLF